MDTVQAIILTQIPIAVSIIILAYEIWLVKKELIRILDKIAGKPPKK